MLTTVTNAQCMKLLLPLFLRMCPTHLGSHCCILVSRGQANRGGKAFRQNHRAGWRLGAHTGEPNQELVILGEGTWELCYLISLKLEWQYKDETQEPHILNWVHDSMCLSRLAKLIWPSVFQNKDIVRGSWMCCVHTGQVCWQVLMMQS